MNTYDPHKIEKKWQKIWEEKRDLYHGEDLSSKPKHYHLIEFPYPSGAGLHVGHCMGYGASDAYARMKRMQGYNVMFPIGWDAFGLPTENFAIKTGRKPADVTLENTDIFRRQMKSMGFSFDWDREVNTSLPSYFRWTQWIFLQFYKHAVLDGKLVEVADDDTKTPRLAYQSEIAINWCPSCKTGLANEEVIAGKCERCGSEVSKRMQKQWMLRITAYADRLIKDLDTVEYLEKIKIQQVNWIGKSTGTNIVFRIQNTDNTIEVFTTRADTLFGCTYVVLAPEHGLIQNIKSQISNIKEVEKYITDSSKKSDMERAELQKDKTGVKLEGIKAVNPINGIDVDIYVADYVLANYGTGAVMAVPAHDDRDYEFAIKYNIPIKEVIIPHRIDKKNPPVSGKKTVERQQIHGIVYDPKTKKYLCVKWNNFPWTAFIVGGVEEIDKDIVETARREINEETGYKNLKFVKVLGGQVVSEYFAKHKDENRKAMVNAIYFELINDERDEVSEEEKNKHKAIWLDRSDINENTMTCAELDLWFDRIDNLEHAFCDYGVLINSKNFDGLSSEEAKIQITEKLKQDGLGDFTVNYKIRDWIFSRQHYWGEPIPIIFCSECAKNYRKSEIQNPKSETNGTISIIDGAEHMIVPVLESDLPLTLPEVENYKPTNTGESPLATINEWVNVKCPKCGGEAKRETDTMPNWAGSSWYFLAYAMNNNNSIQILDNSKNIFDQNKDKLKYWMPVDLYNGGMEHTTLHLLYSRFWNKFLFDLGVAPCSEPYKKRIAHGIILGTDGRKMSKSFGNVINPDDIAKKYGADATRAYIMFIGPYDTESAWNMAGVAGVSRFLTRVYNNFIKVKKDYTDSDELLIKINQSIVGIEDDLENFRLNTVVSKLMELNNVIEKSESISIDSYQIFLQLFFPVAPHLASELWEMVGVSGIIDTAPWPKLDKEYLVADKIEVVIQINGKVRDRLLVSSVISDEELKTTAFESEKVKVNLAGKTIIKTIVVPKKLVSIVVK